MDGLDSQQGCVKVSLIIYLLTVIWLHIPSLFCNLTKPSDGMHISYSQGTKVVNPSSPSSYALASTPCRLSFHSCKLFTNQAVLNFDDSTKSSWLVQMPLVL